ncbi:hypothetical protein Sfulv_03260 [Streptomyces fulvorobeus]|uniref:DUF6777 domain-containing protein n=1 Tax=Streptomyces fulvorobeus TaxID=284028 RepID=A0A7J0BZ24_9ACTN|nr:hypothetical protein [Streptomyces fulvorobeus]GFM95515.1 hypothetical protein Sfulv_03260 [Streptomyces fulvorobeus]
MAVIAVALVAAVVVTVVLTRPEEGAKAGGEVFLQAAGSSGRDPFTESTAEGPKASPTPTAVPSSTSTTTATRVVKGSAPGLYGGTRRTASCDVEKQITALSGAPDRNRAFASVLRIEPAGVPGYLRSLTPVRLRADTRVTNHGFEDGSATAYQAVLQAGTAVMVDGRGVPRVRCACGNPLLAPVALRNAPQMKGAAWPGYRSSDVVVVTPAPTVVKAFVVFDPEAGDWFTREPGDTGRTDRRTDPPAVTSPSPSVSGSRSDAPPDEPSPDTPSPDTPSSDAPPDAPSPEPPTEGSTSEPPPPSPESPPSSAPQSAPQSAQSPPSSAGSPVSAVI